MDALRRVVRALRVAAQRTHSDSGISAAQLFVLRQLVRSPARSLSELAERTLTDRSSVADVVDRLEERGFVRRARSIEDRRRTTIVITLAGRTLLRNAPEAPTNQLIHALDTLDAKTLAALSHGLARLTEAMGIDAEPATMLFEEEAPRD